MNSALMCDNWIIHNVNVPNAKSSRRRRIVDLARVGMSGCGLKLATLDKPPNGINPGLFQIRNSEQASTSTCLVRKINGLVLLGVKYDILELALSLHCCH